MRHITDFLTHSPKITATQNRDISSYWTSKSSNRTDQRSFAGTVVAKNGIQLPCCKLGSNPAQGRKAAELLNEAIEHYYWFCGSFFHKAVSFTSEKKFIASGIQKMFRNGSSFRPNLRSAINLQSFQGLFEPASCCLLASSAVRHSLVYSAGVHI